MKTNKTVQKSHLDSIIRKIVLPKESTGKGNASIALYKMRYGSDWKKYYPVVK
jgi:hypothetical protein